jgi:large subunit ribosomal protein L21
VNRWGEADKILPIDHTFVTDYYISDLSDGLRQRIIRALSVTIFWRIPMYAVISTGGKQYKLAQGDVCRVEKLDAEEGASVEIDKVLMIADGDNINIGAPFVDGGKVTATVKSHGRANKVEIMKFRRRKHHQKKTGHRQYYTEIEVTGISA